MGPQNLNNYYSNRLDVKLDYTSYYDFFLVADERDFNREVVYSKNIIGYDDCEVLPVWIDLGNPSSSLQLTMECGTFYPNNTILSISGTCWCHATPSLKDLDCIDCGVDCYSSGCTEIGGFITSICDIGLTGMDNGWTNSLKRNSDRVEICWSGCGYPYYWELSPETPLLNADDCECNLSEVTDMYTGHFSAGTCWSSSGFTWSPNTNIPEWIKSKIENDYNYGQGIYTFSTNIQQTNQWCGGFTRTSYTIFISDPECLCCPPIIDDEPCSTTTTYPPITTTTTFYPTTTTTTTALYSCLSGQPVGWEWTSDSCSGLIDAGVFPYSYPGCGSYSGHADTYTLGVSIFANGWQDVHGSTLKFIGEYATPELTCNSKHNNCCVGEPGNVTGHYLTGYGHKIVSTCTLGSPGACNGTVYEALVDPSTGYATEYDTWTDLRTAINNTAILPVTITHLMDACVVNGILYANEMGSQITTVYMNLCYCLGQTYTLGCDCVEDPINGTWLDVAACEAAQNCCTGSSVTTTTTCVPDCYALTRCEGNYHWMGVEMEPCGSPFLEDGKYYNLSGTSAGVPYSGCYLTQEYNCYSNSYATVDYNSVSNVYDSCVDCITPQPQGCVEIEYNADCFTNPNYGSSATGFIGGLQGGVHYCAVIDGLVPDASYIGTFFELTSVPGEVVKIIGVTPTAGNVIQNHSSAICGP